MLRQGAGKEHRPKIACATKKNISSKADAGRGRDDDCSSPPHRPVLTLLTHTVPTLETGAPRPLGPARTPDAPEVADVLWHSVQRRPSARESPWPTAFPPCVPPTVPSPCSRISSGTRRSLDSPLPCLEDLMTHRLLLPARSPLAGGRGVSRFSRMEFLCMPGVFDSAGPRHARACASARCCHPCCLTPLAPRNTRFRSSIPSLQIPLSKRFNGDVTAALAWLGAAVVRYTFRVRLLHLLLHAGLSRRYPD
jgi:hypothetical protein